MEIIDFHTHVYPPHANGFWRTASSADDLISALDVAGVSRAAVVAIAPHISNDIVAAAVNKYPERLVGIGSVQPREPDAARQIERAAELNMRAIKLHPRLQRFGAEDFGLLLPIAKRCGDLRLPLVVCSFQAGPGDCGSDVLELCGTLAQSAPGTTIILAHAGGHRVLDAFLLLKAYRNLMVDLSFSPRYFAGSSVAQDLDFLVKRSNPEQLIFGSDFPEAPIGESVDWAMGATQRAGLSTEAVHSIFAMNARNVLRIDN